MAYTLMIGLKPKQFITFCGQRNLFKFFSKEKKITGSYMMFPDIPSDTPANNELLKLPVNDSMPSFSKLNAEKCVKALVKMSIEFETCIDIIEKQVEEKKLQNNLNEVIKMIESHLVPLEYGLSILSLLRNVDKNRYNFKNFNDFYARISGLKANRFQNQNIYYLMREMNSNRNILNDEQKRIVDKYLLEAKLFGTHLSSYQLSTLKEVRNKLEEEKFKYRQNLEEATKRFTHTIDDPSLLRVFPDELISSIGSHSYATVTLHSSVFNPFMEYCPDRQLRLNLWLAYNSRASPKVDHKISNSIPIEQIRSLRKRKATLLGYNNYADLSMETKMARNTQNVQNMISTLHAKSNNAFQNNLKELTDFAKSRGFEYEKLELWDIPYYQRKLLKAKYSIEDSVIRQYFSLQSVLNGLFRLVENLFSVKIEEVDAQRFDLWHKDVQLFQISSNKGIIASFLIDPYRRSNKNNSGNYIHASLTRCQSLKTKPISHLIMNLPPPIINGIPTQLSFNQILMLFNQFGKVLQNSLSEISCAEISGLNNLEWDAIHLVSHFLSLWPLNSYQVFSSCSSHISNGSQIPREEFEKIRRANYHFSSFNLKHELYKIALDMELHSSDKKWVEVTNKVWEEYMSPFGREKDDCHPCSFKDIFCDDYPAAYFILKWSQVLAADIFSAFGDVDSDNKETLLKAGTRFKDTFLSLSGVYSCNEIFRRFMGRDPSSDAYLALNGLIESKSIKDMTNRVSL